jgi:diguanylate cyclase (GGDEF)-like protein
MISKTHRSKAEPAFHIPLRQLLTYLVLASSLPPVLWALLSVPLRNWLASSLSDQGSLVWSTAVVAALSAITGFVIWQLVFVSPVRLMRRTERKLRSLPMRDKLTGLLNRDGLLVALDHAIETNREGANSLGLILLDIDNFQLVNRSFGEIVGDEVLSTIGNRIKGVVRQTDLVARVGGDRFAIVVGGDTGVRGMYVMARNLQRVFEEPVVCSGRSAVLVPTIGLATFGDPAYQSLELIVCAEAAVRSARERGGGQVCRFNAEMQSDAESQLAAQVRLREAMRNSEFELYYQPVVAAHDESIIALEALLRWNDPSRGVVAPGELIPILERSGLITQLGHWVVKTACQQGRDWIDAGSKDLVISVNVSPRQFAESNFVLSVFNVLRDTSFPADQLQLEITEGILLDPTREVIQKLNELTERGIRLALDDFGMGYSSLAYLKLFPLHTLKIDRYFVKDLPGEETDSAIARAVIALGQGLGMHVTAEGVETREQFHLLNAMGCNSIQGYLFSRPVEVSAVTEMLQDQLNQEDKPALPVRRIESRPYLVVPVPRRVRVYRNGEVLGDSVDAMWFIDAQGDSEPSLYLPRHDVKVKLGENGAVAERRHLGEQRYLDLLGHSDQVISPQIAWEHDSQAKQAEMLRERVAFEPNQVVIEESPID